MNNKIAFFDIDYTLFDTDLFKQSGLTKHKLYDEISGVLAELSKIATLGIFSEGDVDFQNKKLKETNLEPFFLKENIFIHARKEDILKNLVDFSDSKVFLIDDKLSILHKAKLAMPELFAIWIKRGPYALEQKEIEDFTPDKTIEDLKSIVDIVEKN